MSPGSRPLHTRPMTQHYPAAPSLAPASSFSGRLEAWRSNLPRRSRHRVLGGVCAGLAEHWGVPPTLVRVGFLAAAVLPGPMWAVYVLAWALMPAADR